MKNRLLLLLALVLIAPQIVAQDFELSTAVSGVVKQVNVKVGEKVKKGQLLLTLDARVFEAHLNEAEKALHSARLSRDEAKKELERAEELYERTVLSDHELNIEKVAFADADAQVAAAERQLQTASYELEYSRVVSPVDGKVVTVNAWPGMVVNNAVRTTTLLVVNR